MKIAPRAYVVLLGVSAGQVQEASGSASAQAVTGAACVVERAIRTVVTGAAVSEGAGTIVQASAGQVAGAVTAQSTPSRQTPGAGTTSGEAVTQGVSALTTIRVGTANGIAATTGKRVASLGGVGAVAGVTSSQGTGAMNRLTSAWIKNLAAAAAVAAVVTLSGLAGISGEASAEASAGRGTGGQSAVSATSAIHGVGTLWTGGQASLSSRADVGASNAAARAPGGLCAGETHGSSLAARTTASLGSTSGTGAVAASGERCATQQGAASGQVVVGATPITIWRSRGVLPAGAAASATQNAVPSPIGLSAGASAATAAGLRTTAGSGTAFSAGTALASGQRIVPQRGVVAGEASASVAVVATRHGRSVAIGEAVTSLIGYTQSAVAGSCVFEAAAEGKDSVSTIRRGSASGETAAASKSAGISPQGGAARGVSRTSAVGERFALSSPGLVSCDSAISGKCVVIRTALGDVVSTAFVFARATVSGFECLVVVPLSESLRVELLEEPYLIAPTPERWRVASLCR